MNSLTLDNGSTFVRLAADGSLLEIKNPYGTFSSTNFIRFGYGRNVFTRLMQNSKKRIFRENDELVLQFSEISFPARFPGHSYSRPETPPPLSLVLRIALSSDEKDQVIFTTEAPQGMDEEVINISFPHEALLWETGEKSKFISCWGCFGSEFSFPSEDWGYYELDPILAVAASFTDKGGMALYTDALHDHTMILSVNNRNTRGCCFFRQDFRKDRSNYTRKVLMQFFPPEDRINTLAKWYRKQVIKENRFISLQDKISADPEVGALAGSVIWKHNVYYGDTLPCGVEKEYGLYVLDKAAAESEGKVANWTAKEIFTSAREKGFDRVCVWNTGWNFMGFDSGYSTRLPVNPLRGSNQEFMDAAKFAKSLSKDYICSVHDNYNDVYANSPEFDPEKLVHDECGGRVRGQIWRGGRSWYMCRKNAFEYAKRDLGKIAELSGRGAIYIDVFGCLPRLDCFHKAHPHSQREDAAMRIAVFREAKKHFGAVATEGAPVDFAVPYVDIGAFQAIKPPEIWNSRPVPFFQLIYHDSIYNFTGQGISGYYGKEYYNYAALYGLLPDNFSEDSLKISRLMRHLHPLEMCSFTDHGNGLLSTTFADGSIVTANMGEKDLEGIGPKEYKLQRK